MRHTLETIGSTIGASMKRNNVDNFVNFAKLIAFLIDFVTACLLSSISTLEYMYTYTHIVPAMAPTM